MGDESIAGITLDYKGEATRRPRRVELPTIDEIDAELREMAERRKWLMRVKRFIVRMGAGEAKAE